MEQTDAWTDCQLLLLLLLLVVMIVVVVVVMVVVVKKWYGAHFAGSLWSTQSCFEIDRIMEHFCETGRPSSRSEELPRTVRIGSSISCWTRTDRRGIISCHNQLQIQCLPRAGIVRQKLFPRSEWPLIFTFSKKTFIYPSKFLNDRLTAFYTKRYSLHVGPSHRTLW